MNSEFCCSEIAISIALSTTGEGAPQGRVWAKTCDFIGTHVCVPYTVPLNPIRHPKSDIRPQNSLLNFRSINV